MFTSLKKKRKGIFELLQAKRDPRDIKMKASQYRCKDAMFRLQVNVSQENASSLSMDLQVNTGNILLAISVIN